LASNKAVQIAWAMVQESKKLFEEMGMKAQGTHASVAKPTYTVALF